MADLKEDLDQVQSKSCLGGDQNHIPQNIRCRRKRINLLDSKRFVLEAFTHLAPVIVGWRATSVAGREGSRITVESNQSVKLSLPKNSSDPFTSVPPGKRGTLATASSLREARHASSVVDRAVKGSIVCRTACSLVDLMGMSLQEAVYF